MGEGFTYTGAGGRDLKGTKANPKNVRDFSFLLSQAVDTIVLT